jgi:outer membrane lipoprotein-sorting protein
MVYVRDDALETTDSYPVGRTPLKFLLAKKVDRNDAKLIQVDRGVDNVAVTFSSSDEETEGELTLIASAPDLTLRRWIVRDLQGGMTVVTLDNVKAGERLANSLFAAPDAGGRFINR